MKKPIDVINLYEFEDNVLKKASDIQEELREDFNHFENNHKYIGMMTFIHYPLLIETASYYNGELLASYSIFKALTINESNYRVKAFHFENLLFRIVAFWEYTYQFINHYLNLGLVDFKAKNIIIQRSCYQPKLLKREFGSEIIWEELPEEIAKKNKKKLEKELKLINQKNIILYVKGLYEVKDNVLLLLTLIRRNNLKYVKDIRNQVIHQRAAGASYTVNFDMMLSDYSVSINNNGWIDFEIAEREIDVCINIIHETIKTIHKIILNNEYPNRIENSGIKYSIFKVLCRNCNHKFNYPSYLLGENRQFEKTILCPKCKQIKCELKSEIESTELDHNNILGQYLASFEE